jgi:hypothetical protein
MREDDPGADGGYWRALAQVEREVTRVRDRLHTHVEASAARYLDHERRVTKLETRLALYAALGGSLAGLAVGLVVQIFTGSP